MSKNSEDDFETTLKNLEQIVESMEKGDLSLEKSIGAFEQGIKLAGKAQKVLKEAQLKVDILVNENDQWLSEYQESGE